MFGLPAPLRDRIDAKKALPKLNAALQWLRIVEFSCCVAIMGIFLTFSVGLPHGFTTSNHLTVVWALTIVAALYPILLWLSFIYFKRRSKVLFLRVARATDSFIAAPILIALAIVLGDSGLPGKCDELYRFDDRVWRTGASFKRSLLLRDDVPCNSTDRSNECGTGATQIKGLQKMCRTAQAGFGLTIAAIVVMYVMIMIANFYISLKPNDTPSLSPRPSRTRRNRSSGVQTGPEMSQLPQPRDSLIDPSGEPPPPYTARPGQGETIAVAPTSHPAIARVAASRVAIPAAVAVDVNRDVERLAGSEDPCVEYDSLENLSGGMGISLGIQTQTPTQPSAGIVVASSSSTPTSTAATSTATISIVATSSTVPSTPTIPSTAPSTPMISRTETSVTATTNAELEQEPETPSADIPRTVHHTTSTTPLIRTETSEDTPATPS